MKLNQKRNGESSPFCDVIRKPQDRKNPDKFEPRKDLSKEGSTGLLVVKEEETDHSRFAVFFRLDRKPPTFFVAHSDFGKIFVTKNLLT